MFSSEPRNFYSVNKEIARAPLTDEQTMIALYEQERNNTQAAFNQYQMQESMQM